MITAIEIENFKGIGPRQRIELAPITLLFGANSSGKSTIIHALHYALEVLQRHNCDAQRTVFGGEFIDLGGFRSFVHGRDLKRRVAMRFELNLSAHSLPRYGEQEAAFSILDEGHADQVERAAVEIQVAWDQQAQTAIVARYSVELNGVQFAALETDAGRRATVLAELNWNHPLLQEQGDEQAAANKELQDLHSNLVILHGKAGELGLLKGPPPYLAFGVLHRLVSKALGIDEADVQPSPGWGLAGLDDALPTWGAVLEPALPLRAENTEAAADPEGQAVQSSQSKMMKAAKQFATLLTQLLVGPGELLTQALGSTRYLGPLREKPLRSHDAQHVGDATRWASGLAAWDALYQQNTSFLALVSDWLSRSDHLGAGVSLTRREYREIAIDDPIFARLAGGHAFDDLDLADFRDHLWQIPVRRKIVLMDEATGVQYQPFDVGEGISQLVPVVVAMLEPTSGVIAVEQPELHVHPAIQVGLGDLIAFGLGVNGVTRLVETHSEHLLLRILRRIRDTGDSGLDHVQHVLSPDDVAVWYIEAVDGATQATRLRVDASGEFVDRWPKGFFEERAQELF
ncbi:MAG: hypothetical protein AMXMBFR47_36560 [Planctomycetota bacterium]